ncbi:preprotein translocase subunit SecG [Persephonella sp.]|uniref:preprotein translocase subunit SecG n=1 Tax=Persephonella sp. TaxID=2060922 RepID=UPI0025E1AFC7|nr:preprotein translocase subunit SecG [Persephonella sp.]
MDILFTVLSILLIIDAVLLIIIVLMQKTKGAEIGAIFGSGAAAAVLGAGASNILTKITYWLGGLFMFLVFALSFIHHKSVKSSSVISDLPETQQTQQKQK